MHSLLRRQLAKLSFHKESLPGSLTQWQDFIDSVDQSYSEADQDHYMMEHSLEICSTEMMGLQQGLELRVQERTAELGKEISERRRTEETLAHTEVKLLQSQKMEAIGRLAGGVAHDFNNLLSVVLGHTEIILGTLGKTDPLYRHIEEIRRASLRGADLTKQLLAFSRQQVLQPKVIDLNEILLGMENMLSRLVGEDIELIVKREPRLGNVKADPSQIEQVIMNLVINARDAMPKGGKITVSTSNIDLDGSFQADHLDTQAGPHVLFSVADQGVGMALETVSLIFDPFFTTKDKGKGTGLGLSTVLGIIKQSKGAISVSSTVGMGTIFKVVLPITTENLSILSSSTNTSAIVRGTETILLVEDEAQLRELLVKVLRDYGYHVLEAADPTEALTLAASCSQHIHLLLTDVVMPKMGGEMLAKTLVAQHPSLQVVYMSGYTNDAILRHGIQHSDIPFLQKPFTAKELVRIVRQVLDQGKSAL